MAKAAAGRPGPARRVIEFRAPERAAAGRAPGCDEHLAIWQQRRRVLRPCVCEAAGGCPGSARRVVQFRARERLDGVVVLRSGCDQHFAVGKQRRRVKPASGGEPAGGCPGPVRRIVEFRAREDGVAVNTAHDEHLAIRQQRRRVISACDGEATGGRPSPAHWIVEFRAVAAHDEHLAVR